MSSDDYTFANEPVKLSSGLRRDVSSLNALDGYKFKMCERFLGAFGESALTTF